MLTSSSVISSLSADCFGVGYQCMARFSLHSCVSSISLLKLLCLVFNCAICPEVFVFFFVVTSSFYSHGLSSWLSSL